MKKTLPALLCLPAAISSATVFLYDGFAAGGDTPGSGQYQTAPASTNGNNNSALNGQNPSVLGFATSAWANLDGVASTVHPRAIDGGLTWSDGSGNSLITSPGAAEIFRSGTQSGTLPSSQYKRARRDTTGIAGPSGEFYLSALFQFTAGVEGRLDINAGGGDRSHFIGFNTSGNLVAGALGAGSVSTASPEFFAAATTHFVIARFVDGGFGNRTVDLWINPSDITIQGTADYTFSANYFDGHSSATSTR